MRIGLWVVVLLVVVGAGAGVQLLVRPEISATSSVVPEVTIQCVGSTGVEETACLAWDDEILAEGSPTTTFEAEDVVRLRLDRELLGFGDSCRAEWFLGRYPDDVAWSESVACAR